MLHSELSTGPERHFATDALDCAEKSYSLERTHSVAIAMKRQLDLDLIEDGVSRACPLRVVLATTDILAAEEFCEVTIVSLLILDAGFPKNQSLEVGSKIIGNKTARQLLFLDDYYCSYRAREAVSLSAGYVSRSIEWKHFVNRVVKMATDGKIRPSRANGLVESESQWQLDLPEVEALSKRETEILTLLAEGFSVRNCAAILSLSASTVDNHKSSLMKKLMVHKSADLVRLAVRSGLVDA
jgi:DNA-binding NarL/FixJ family response regulator